MQMLQVPSSDAEDLLMAMEEWMFEMIGENMDDMWMPTYDEVDAFLQDNNIMSLTQDIYAYITGPDFKPLDDADSFDALLNMLGVDS
jgi:hypothetical protein